MSHQCPRNGCARVVPDSRLMCAADWRQVPKPLQRAVYATYNRGKGLGSPQLLAAQDAAIRAVNGEPEPRPGNAQAALFGTTPPGCDADQFGDGPASVLDGRCRCMVCARCGHHTGNSNQGHYWSWCKVTKTIRKHHFCCRDPEVRLRAGDGRESVMSWDATLYAVAEVTDCEHCGQKLPESRREKSGIGWWNYTHNINDMIAVAYEAVSGEMTEQCGGPLGKAIGPAWWRRLDGAIGADGGAYLSLIITGLEADPGRFRAMNPPNGWGSYDGPDGLLGVLREMRDAVPDDRASVWAVSG